MNGGIEGPQAKVQGRVEAHTIWKVPEKMVEDSSRHFDLFPPNTRLSFGNRLLVYEVML